MKQPKLKANIIEVPGEIPAEANALLARALFLMHAPPALTEALALAHTINTHERQKQARRTAIEQAAAPLREQLATLEAELKRVA